MKKNKIIGIGNIGYCVIKKMLELGADEFDYIEISQWGSDINNLNFIFNEDYKHLKEKIKVSTFLVGEKIGHGVLGNGANTDTIYEYDLAYKESETKLNEFLNNELINTDMVIIITP